MKCLVVHGSATLRRALQNALRRAGCDDVVATPDAAQALESCDGSAGALIVARELPGTDGLELVRRVRAGAACGGTRILMVSTRHRPEDVRAAVQAGVDVYLLEPFSARALEEKITELLAPVRETGGDENEERAQAA